MKHDPAQHLFTWRRTVILEPIENDYYGIYRDDRGTFARARLNGDHPRRWLWVLNITDRSFSGGETDTLPAAIDEIERQFAAWLAGAKAWPPATA